MTWSNMKRELSQVEFEFQNGNYSFKSIVESKVDDQQTKTNSQKRLLGIFDFPPIYVKCLLSKNIFVLSFL